MKKAQTKTAMIAVKRIVQGINHTIINDMIININQIAFVEENRIVTLDRQVIFCDESFNELYIKIQDALNLQ